MRLCADENVPEDCVDLLRSHGHDVLWIRESHPGVADLEVLRLAHQQERVLLTLDKDFGDLVYRHRASPVFGIVLFRMPFTSAVELGARMVAALKIPNDWPASFSVVDGLTVRVRPLR